MAGVVITAGLEGRQARTVKPRSLGGKRAALPDRFSPPQGQLCHVGVVIDQEARLQLHQLVLFKEGGRRQGLPLIAAQVTGEVHRLHRLGDCDQVGHGGVARPPLLLIGEEGERTIDDSGALLVQADDKEVGAVHGRHLRPPIDGDAAIPLLKDVAFGPQGGDKPAEEPFVGGRTGDNECLIDLGDGIEAEGVDLLPCASMPLVTDEVGVLEVVELPSELTRTLRFDNPGDALFQIPIPPYQLPVLEPLDELVTLMDRALKD